MDVRKTINSSEALLRSCERLKGISVMCEKLEKSAKGLRSSTEFMFGAYNMLHIEGYESITEEQKSRIYERIELLSHRAQDVFRYTGIIKNTLNNFDGSEENKPSRGMIDIKVGLKSNEMSIISDEQYPDEVMQKLIDGTQK